MRVFVTGGTGLIGSQLVRQLLERGDECVIVSRSGRDPWDHERARVVRGDPTAPGEWQRAVSGCDAVVNLAGQPIVDPPHRWTAARKRLLRDSRVDTARQVVAAMRAAERVPAVLVSASAIGFYGNRGDETLDESATSGTGFLAELSVAWEAAARSADDVTRVVCLRTGLVLDRSGGALAPLVPLFKLGLGGPWGEGSQWWSWIHAADEVGLIRFAIDADLSGPLNLTAPNPVTVNAFAAALGRSLNRPAIVRAPAFAMRLTLGEMADALLTSQRVVPRRALDGGYAFRFPELDGALADLFG
ncbi:MAG: TIGR01777 family oxidoreductase [Gemmatimonadota bacterium]|nr:MAG: TIGR01777 family oxidoreductase [Gemmatimonadota bacterium]